MSGIECVIVLYPISHWNVNVIVLINSYLIRLWKTVWQRLRLINLRGPKEKSLLCWCNFFLYIYIYIYKRGTDVSLIFNFITSVYHFSFYFWWEILCWLLIVSCILHLRIVPCKLRFLIFLLFNCVPLFRHIQYQLTIK